MDKLIKVVEHYKLQVNRDNKCVCPFHGDVNPSLKLNFKENFWWCFGCQRRGDAYELHKTFQNQKGEYSELKNTISYNKIIKGEKLPDEVINYVNNTSSQKHNLGYYREKLKEAKDYYYGLPEINWYEVGDIEELSYLKYRGYTLKTIQNSGAKLTHKEYTYSLIFPILDNGKFKGWVSRTLNPKLAKTRKYLYNTGLKKKQTLAGNYRNTDTVIVVEGYLDMLKAKQLGFKKVVALLGWQISEQQVLKLKSEGVKSVISALDNDECGNKGSELLKNYFDKVNRFVYPKGIKDMGDMNKYKLKLSYIKEE